MSTHDWWVYRKTAKVAHAVPMTDTSKDAAGTPYIRNGTAACGTVLWIYASPAAADVKRCPKCVKALKGAAEMGLNMVEPPGGAVTRKFTYNRTKDGGDAGLQV